MKVLEKRTMPDGTKIQLEDWTEIYTCYTTLTIAAYPIKMKSENPKRSYFSQIGEPMRVSLTRCWKNNEEVREAFDELSNGKKTLLDFKDTFSDPWRAQCLNERN